MLKVRVDGDLLAELRRQADSEGRSVSDMARRAIIAGLAVAAVVLPALPDPPAPSLPDPGIPERPPWRREPHPYSPDPARPLHCSACGSPQARH